MTSHVQPYIALLERFGRRELTADEFEKEYLALYKNDQTDWGDVEFAILDELFSAVDAFCADPSLRDENDLDEDQLRDAARQAWRKMQSL